VRCVYSLGMSVRNRLDHSPNIERSYTPNRKVMLAALRVVLGLPKRALAEIDEEHDETSGVLREGEQRRSEGA
jgi:hypothetical protein